MFGLKGLSESQESGSDAEESDSNTSDPDDYDDLDYTDFNWTGGRYDYQEQKDFIKKIVFRSSGYAHDPKKTSKERYKERKRILNDRNTQHRRIFCLWPSSDKIMPPLDSSGNLTDGFNPPLHNNKGRAPPNAPAMWNGPGIWGATLFDFYDIACLHPNLSWQTSGSKMLEWCLKNGDSSAEPQMAWALTEPVPELIEPCDIGQLIEDSENHMRMLGNRVPGLPFAEPTPVLQQYLPYHLLPSTLVVYDPDQLLYPSGEKGTSVEHRYKLQVSAKYDERRKEDEAREAQVAAEQKKIREALTRTISSLPAGCSTWYRTMTKRKKGLHTSNSSTSTFLALFALRFTRLKFSSPRTSSLALEITHSSMMLALFCLGRPSSSLSCAQDALEKISILNFPSTASPLRSSQTWSAGWCSGMNLSRRSRTRH